MRLDATDLAPGRPNRSPILIAELDRARNHLEKLFRAHNGSSYDSRQRVDRRKMEQLKRGSAVRE